MSTLKEKVEKYCELEEEIMDDLSKLPRVGQECNCDEQETFSYVHEGNHFDEIIIFCITCGGYVEKIVG